MMTTDGETQSARQNIEDKKTTATHVSTEEDGLIRRKREDNITMDRNANFHSTTTKFSSIYNIDYIKEKWRKTIVATIVLNIFLPNLVLSYGVIGNTRTEYGHPKYELFITPTIFCGIWTILEPMFSDVIGLIKSKLILLASVVLCLVGIIANIWSENIIYHTIFYGLLGGLGSSVIRSQINNLIDDNTFTKKESDKIRFASFYSQAIGQSVLPYAYMVIFTIYGHSMGYLIISSLILHILPAVILIIYSINDGNKITHLNNMYRRGYSIFDDLNSVMNGITEVPLEDLSKRSQDHESHFIKDHHIDEDNTANTYQEFHKLSQILEENEELDNEEEIKSNTRETNIDENIRPTSYKTLDVSEIFEAPNDETNSTMNVNKSLDNVSNVYKTTLCTRFINNSYKKMATFKHYLKYHWQENFLYSAKLALITWEFYPALLLRVSSQCLFFYFSSLTVLLNTPLVLMLNVTVVAILISGHGLSWLMYLILTSWLDDVKKSRYKIISSFGLLTSSSGLFMIYEFHRQEFIFLGAIFCGIGYGALTTSSNETCRDSIGIKKWPRLKGLLEYLSAILVIAIGIWMSFLLTWNNGTDLCFQLLMSILVLTGIIWIVIVFVKVLHSNDQRINDPVWPNP